jgi:hypothetical protein
MKAAAKDLFYASVPPALARHVLPWALPGSNPFLPELMARRVIFIHVPKAAGSSVKTEIYGRPLGGHRSIAEFYAYDPRRADAFLKIAFVRNPWDRLLSAWSYLRQGEGVSGRDRRFAREHLATDGDFPAFLRALEGRRFRRTVLAYDHFRPQSHWICRPGQSGHAMDVLGRFERIDADMAEVRTRLGLPPRTLKQVRPSDHPPWRDVYDPRGRDLVADLYARDLALTGYGF